MLLPVSIVEIDNLQRRGLIELLEREERDPALTRWVLFIKRGPMGNVSTVAEMDMVQTRFQTTGPKAPYSGLLLLYRGGAEPCEQEKEMRHRVSVGAFNLVVRQARTSPIKQAVHIALLT